MNNEMIVTSDQLLPLNQMRRQPVNERLCVYFPGKLNLECFAYRDTEGVGRMQFSRAPIQPLLEKGAVLLPFSEVSILLHEAQTKTYCKAWRAVSKAVYDDMLDVLPPERMGACGCVSFFSMCEYQTGNLTSFYARYSGTYWTAIRDAQISGQRIMTEVLEAHDRWLTKAVNAG